MGGGYKVYEEYRDSGVEWLGAIPQDWELWKIAHACPYVASGTTPKTDTDLYFGGKYLWVTTGELRENNIIDTQKKVNELALEDFPTLRLHPVGAVAIAMYGATIGRLGIFSKQATTNQACCVIPPTEVLHSKYLFYWLLATRNEIVNLSSGGGQPNVNQEKIASLRVSAPTYPDQAQIANFLDHETAKIDTLIEKQQQLIKLLKEKRQAVISHAVTKGLNPDAPMRDSGVEWLGDVPAHWEIRKFSRCVLIGSGLVDPRISPFSGYNLIAPNHIESETGRLTNYESAEEQGADSGKYLCNHGEVIYSKIRPNLAKVCIAPDSTTICSADMYTLDGDESLENGFLFWTLLSSWFTSFVVLESDRVAMPKINREKLSSVRLAIPPVKEQMDIISSLQISVSTIDVLTVKTSDFILLG